MFNSPPRSSIDCICVTFVKTNKVHYRLKAEIEELARVFYFFLSPLKIFPVKVILITRLLIKVS